LDQPLLSLEVAYDGTVVKDTAGNIKKLIFVYHIEGSLHCKDIQRAQSSDSQWFIAADIFTPAGSIMTRLG
jgi:hypothetical protein